MQDHSTNMQENGINSIGNHKKVGIRKKTEYEDDHDNLDSTLIEKNSKESSETLFANIVGYEDIKKIFNYAFNSSLPGTYIAGRSSWFGQNPILDGMYETFSFLFYAG